MGLNMVHASTRQAVAGARRRRPQAVRRTAPGRRLDLRGPRAMVGALLVSIVALVGQAAHGEVAAWSGQSAMAQTDQATSAAEVLQEPTWALNGPIRQGGDVIDAVTSSAEHSATSGSGAPVRPTVWYRLAAAEFGVSRQLLEALHQVESNASPDACIANLEGSGATGPFQFKPATFALFGVDANHDGAKDICGFVDSLFSAARYLHAIGADDDPSSETTRRALKRYGTDAERVVSLARAYQERDGLLALAPAAMRE